MKKIDLPEYAQKFKVKGYDVKKVGNTYYQYKVDHYRVEGKSYPLSKLTYIGKIDEKKGLIKAYTQKDDVVTYLEYGLSNFLFKYKRILQRVLFNLTGEYADKIIRLGIIYFIFNEISLNSLKASYLTYYEADELFKYYCSYDRNKNRVKALCNKITEILKETFEDKNDLDNVLFSLRNMNVIITDKNEKINSNISLAVKEIFDKYGVKYE